MIFGNSNVKDIYRIVKLSFKDSDDDPNLEFTNIINEADALRKMKELEKTCKIEIQSMFVKIILKTEIKHIFNVKEEPQPEALKQWYTLANPQFYKEFHR